MALFICKRVTPRSCPCFAVSAGITTAWPCCGSLAPFGASKACRVEFPERVRSKLSRSHGSGSAESCAVPAQQTRTDASQLRGARLVAETLHGSYGVAYRLDGLDEHLQRPRCGRGVSLHGWRVTRHIFPSGRGDGRQLGLSSCRRATWRRWMPFCNASRG